MRALLALCALLALAAAPAQAQQRLAFVDSEAILQALPEYQTARQQVDRLGGEWQAELDAMQAEIDELVREFEARELLYTDEDRQRALDEIAARRTEMNQYRRRQFGPDGELFRQEQQLLRPIQERVLEALETVADEGGYDFVFDRSGDLVFLYARETHNVTDLVLVELGIDPQTAGVGN
ncbi:MAG: OmpH family outer membrane protein [Rubricoccaceae bacterium]|nr:OmpH family outer membrane protein [Rubricoccaceae bacterium]